MTIIDKIRHSEYAKSALVIIIIVGVVLGGFVGLQVALNTSVPIRVVESGSMCIPYDGACEGWLAFTHVFERTLHTGDIIIVQGVSPEELNTNYPNSDIIVYLNPDNTAATPIVHRIVTVENIDGTLYFQTKGDGNGQKWPAVPSPSEYDSHTLWVTGDGKGVPEDLVVGKVVMRIPYFGHITLFLRENSWGLPLIIALILLLIVLEFIIPIIKKGTKTEQTQLNSESQAPITPSI